MAYVNRLSLLRTRADSGKLRQVTDEICLNIRIGRNAPNALNHLGVHVLRPPGQDCCCSGGYPPQRLIQAAAEGLKESLLLSDFLLKSPLEAAQLLGMVGRPALQTLIG